VQRGILRQPPCREEPVLVRAGDLRIHPVHEALERELSGEVGRRDPPIGFVGVLDLPAHDAVVAAQLEVVEDVVGLARELDRELPRCLCDRDRKQAGTDEVLELVAAVGAPEAARFGQRRVRHIALRCSGTDRVRRGRCPQAPSDLAGTTPPGGSR
jgi:hypothetical protein